jgi:cell division protein FtsB
MELRTSIDGFQPQDLTATLCPPYTLKLSDNYDPIFSELFEVAAYKSPFPPASKLEVDDLSQKTYASADGDYDPYPQPPSGSSSASYESKNDSESIAHSKTPSKKRRQCKDVNEEKEKEKAEKSRVSSRLTRIRKNEVFESLKIENSKLTAKIEELVKSNKALKKENNDLRRELKTYEDNVLQLCKLQTH